MNRSIVLIVAAMLAVGAAHAANDKSQAQAQDKGKGTNQAQSVDYVRDQDKGKSGDKDPSNRGQVVSECNHRANDKQLKGQERKDYVEWCESRGARYGYKDGDYNRERDCYRRAFERSLSGEKRQSYLHECLETSERKYESSKSRDKDGKSDGVRLESAGREVSGTGDGKKKD